MFRRIALVFASLLFCIGQAASQSLPAPSAWLNQRGSYLFVYSIDASGKFKGAYYNNAAGTGCQNSPFDVTGVVKGADITFVVTWKNSKMSCNSITAWRGTISGQTIYTTWQLANAAANTGLIQIQSDSATFQRAELDVRTRTKRRP